MLSPIKQQTEFTQPTLFQPNYKMFSEKNRIAFSNLSEDFEFWRVFIDDIPRVPTVDELICRIVGIHYPEGIVMNGQGNLIKPARDIQKVTKQILFTLQIAIDTERDFWVRYLREARVTGPFAGAVKLSASVAMEEAETLILGALEWVGNVLQLDSLYHAAYMRTLYYCTTESRELLWPPFGDDNGMFTATATKDTTMKEESEDSSITEESD